MVIDLEEENAFISTSVTLYFLKYHLLNNAEENLTPDENDGNSKNAPKNKK